VGSYSFLWEAVIASSSNKFWHIAPDLLGCGYSDKPDHADHSITGQAELMVQFMDQLNISKIHLIGHDLGGGIAQILAVKYPQRIKTLTLINSVGYDHWPVQPISTMRAPIIRNIASSIMGRSTYQTLLRIAVLDKSLLSDALVDQFWQPLSDSQGLKGFFNLIKAINNKLLTEITPQLKKLNTPTLIIRADSDAFLSKRISEKLIEDIPNSRLKIVPKAGHFIQVDKPREVASLIEGFIHQ
jgi:pimeloyl-ACP methyl ester carboxylesterase